MKNTMKKFLSSVLAVIILLGIVPITDLGVEASAASEYTEGYYTYTVENDKATITDVDTSISGDVTIPSSLGGYPVTTLRYNAFDSCMKVTSITIPEPLTTLTGESFFAGVPSENIFVAENNPVFTSDNGVLFNSDKTKLVAYPAGRKDLSYTIPETVDTIGAYAFSATLYLETVNIPDSVKNIEYAAFAYSQRLKEVALPESVEFMDYGVFWMCKRLEKLSLPKNLTYLYDETFQFCYSLREVILPDDITYLEGFSVLPMLKEITVPEKVKEVHWIDDCFSLEKIVLPESVQLLSGVTAPFLKDLYIYNSELQFDDVDLKTISNITKEELVKAHNDAAFAEIYMEDMLAGADEEELQEIADELNRIYMELLKSAEYAVSDELTIHGYLGSTAEAYAKENGIRFEEIKEITDITVSDTNTNITAEYDSTTFESDVNLVIIPEGNNANIIFEDQFSKYASYDISFELNGTKVQPNGKVTIKVPIPEGYNADTTVVYYVDDNGVSSKLDSSHENGYIIFETDHFSEYVLVDESSKIDEPTTEPDEPSENNGDCSCMCHKGGFMGFIYKILRFFWKLFKINPVCDCGINHY